MTRFELHKELRISLSSTDRLIAAGLEAEGRRGKAKLYDPIAARALAHKLAPTQAAASDVVMGDYRSHAEDLADRLYGLHEAWIADTAWLPAWRRYVTAVDRLTASWPRYLADRIGAVPRDAARGLLAADGPRVALDTEAARRVPPPIFRPLLSELASAIAGDPATVTMARVVTPPPPAKMPAPASTVEEARAQWREARANYRRARIAVRRGHRRRAQLFEQIRRAVDTFRTGWWAARGQLGAVAGDRAAALAWATRLRRETLQRLATLDGVLPETETRRKSA